MLADHSFDYIILDEAHRIKNDSQQTLAAKRLVGKRKIIITGTPIMNRLDELYNLVDFVTDGRLFKSYGIMNKQQFIDQYAKVDVLFIYILSI